jgi:hypothetical protein
MATSPNRGTSHEMGVLVDRWRALLDNADAKSANCAFDKIVALFRRVRGESGSQYRSVLTEMLQNGSADLRVFACGELLFESPEVAVNILETIAKEDGEAAFSASMMLLEWRAGELKRLT